MFGGKYTWVGKRYKHEIKKKINKVVANADWLNMFQQAHVKVLNWLGSDHKPLVLYTEDRKWKGKKLFKYDNRWRFNPEAREEIQKT